MKLSRKTAALGALFAAALLAGSAALAQDAFEAPVLITSAGQSIEASTVNFHFEKANVKAILEPLASPAKLEGVKTLVIAPGHSLKGLGSAGIDEVSELARVKKIVEAAHDAGIPIICIHIGGKARRGATSQPFIEASMQYAAACIVYDAGNEDGYFTQECAARGIPLITMPKAAFLAKNLKPLFPQQ
jgi:hypothetical protein